MFHAQWKFLLAGLVLIGGVVGTNSEASAHWGILRPAWWSCDPCVRPLWGWGYSYALAVSCCDGWWPAYRVGWRHRAWTSCCWWDCCTTWDCCSPCLTDLCCGETLAPAAPAAPAKGPTLAPPKPAPPTSKLTTPEPIPEAAPSAPANPPLPKPEIDTLPKPAPPPSPFRGTGYEVPGRGDSGLLTVHVPAKAIVLINGDQTRSTGSRREYVSYGLEPGKQYRYQVKALIECAPYVAMDGKVLLPDGSAVLPDKDQTIVYQGGDRVAIDGTTTLASGAKRKVVGTKVTPSNRERELDWFEPRTVTKDGKQATLADWRVKEVETAIIEKPNGLRVSVVERIERRLAGEPAADGTPQYAEKSRQSMLRLWDADGTVPEDRQPVLLPTGAMVVQGQAIVLPDGTVLSKKDKQWAWITKTVTLRAGDRVDVSFTDSVTIDRALVAAAEQQGAKQ